MANAGGLGRLVVSVGTDVKELKAGMAQVNSQLAIVKKKNVQTAATVGDVWVNAAAKVFVFTQALRGIQTAFNATLGVAVKFESAFAGVRKTVDATEKEFGKISDGLRKMSVEMGVSAASLAKVTEIAGQLGIRGSGNLLKFTRVVQMLAETTNLSAEEASFSLARLIKLSGDSIDNIDRVGSVVTDLGNTFETTEREIVKMATRIAGVGNIAGLTSAEILGISTAFTAAGIKAELGGTAIQKVLLELIQRGKKGRKEFVKFLNGIADAGDDAGARLDELGFSSERLKTAFISVAVSGGSLEGALKRADEAYEENTALTEEFAKRMATTEKQFDRNRVALENLRLEMFQNLLPTVTALSEGFTKFLEILTAIEEKTGAISAFAGGGFTGGGAMLGQDQEGAGIGGLMAGPAGIGGGLGAGKEGGEGGGLSDVAAEGGGADLGGGGGGKDTAEELKRIKDALKTAEKALGVFDTTFNKSQKDLGKLWGTTIDGMVTSFAGGFSSMIIDGKKFSDSMKEGFQSMAKSFITAVLSMIIKWIAFIAAVMATALVLAFFGVPIGSTFKTAFKLAQGPSAFAKGADGARNGAAVFARNGAVMAKNGLATAQTGIATTGSFGEGGIPATLHPNEIVAPIEKFFGFFDDLQGHTFNIYPPEGDPREIAEMVAFEVEKIKRNP